MENENLKKYIHWANISSLLIVSLAVVFIIIAAIWFFWIPDKSIKQTLEVKYSVDSLIKSDSTIKNLKLSNQLVYNKIDSLLQNQQKRESEILESSKNQADFVSFASAIFALIFSIAGFFGFKSINEIKKDALDSAIKKAKEVTDNYVRDYASQQLGRITEDAVSNIISTYISPLEDRLNEINSGQNNSESETNSNNEEQPFNGDGIL